MEKCDGRIKLTDSRCLILDKMAFSCSLTGQPSPQYICGNGEHLFISDIGICDETGAAYKVTVALAPFRMCKLGEFELQFYLSEISATGEIAAFESGTSTRTIITSANDRDAVLNEICISSVGLCAKTAAQTVFWSPSEQNLPDKAIKKFERIAAALRVEGYEVRTVNRYHGYTEWIASRRGGA